jgi:hypothetical protein
VTPRDDTDDAHRAGAADPAEPTPGSEADEDGTAGFDEWRRRSAVGDVGTAIARGLGAVFAPSENRQVVSAPVPGDPPDADLGFRVVLDPDDPTKAVAVFDSKAAAEDEQPPGAPPPEADSGNR